MEYMMMYDIIVVSRGGNRSRENASEDHRGISDSDCQDTREMFPRHQSSVERILGSASSQSAMAGAGMALVECLTYWLLLSVLYNLYLFVYLFRLRRYIRVCSV
ncbi:hypothetical protein C5167_030153 [Papaver somniferum]|nr:hypothetical protein C5167_030153 [Papaver somniferum]